MIRKIILMLLIFWVMVQGVSGAVHSINEGGGSYELVVGIGESYTTHFNGSMFYADGTPATISYNWKSDGISGVDVKFSDSSNDCSSGVSYLVNNVLTSGSGVTTSTDGLNSLCVRGGGNTSARIFYSVSLPNTASGESCNDSDVFDLYSDGVNFGHDDNDGNYSFSIIDGVEYQVYSHISDEWHNFTASGNEEWSPICTDCSPQSGNQTEHGRGSESWLDYFGHLWDGVHSDLILSGNGHFQVYVGGELFYNVFAGTHTIPFSSDFDGQGINVYFTNSTISGTWWNYTNHINEDATWIIEGCGGEQGGISGTITDEFGDGLFGLTIEVSEFIGGEHVATSFSDSSGNFELPTLLEGVDYSLWLHGSGLDTDSYLIGIFNTNSDGLVWDIPQFTLINPTLEIRVQVDGSYETDYSALIIDHNAGNDSIIYSRAAINPTSSTYTASQQINWNDVLIRVTAKGSTQDFSYLFSNVRDTQFNYPCWNDACAIDIIFNSSNAPAPPIEPIWGNESNLTKDFLLNGYLRGSDKPIGARSISGALVKIDCDDGSFGTNVFNYSSGQFEVLINKTSCSDISYTAPGYIPEKFVNRNWTEWDWEFVTLNRIPSECTTPVIIDGISETRINQESEFSTCAPISIPSYTVTIHDPDGALVQSWTSLDGLKNLKYTYTMLGTYTISILNEGITSKHNVIGSDGNVNWMRVSPLVVNKYLGSFKISYFSNSSFNFINLSSNGSSILVFNTIANQSSHRDIDRDVFSLLSVGDIIDIYFMDNFTQLEYAFVTLTGGTITTPCGTPDCKIIKTSTTSSYKDLSYENMANKLFSNTILIAIIMLLMIMLCINRYYITVVGIWVVYSYEVHMIPNIVFFTIVTILILVFSYKITNVGGNNQ